MYKIITSSELVWPSYDYILPYNKVLPEAICCCLQTCNFDVVCMLVNNVSVQIVTSSELVWPSYDYILPYNKL